MGEGKRKKGRKEEGKRGDRRWRGAETHVEDVFAVHAADGEEVVGGLEEGADEACAKTGLAFVGFGRHGA